jgi:hypothetical protein
MTRNGKSSSSTSCLAPVTSVRGSRRKVSQVRSRVYLPEKRDCARQIGSELRRHSRGAQCMTIFDPWTRHFQERCVSLARWREDVDLNGKDVLVLGSGCSAAQIVPSLLKEPYNVKSLTQIGRSAPWVMPRLPEPFGKAKYAPTVYKWFPFLGYLNRVLIYLLVEVIWSTVFQMKHAKWRAVVEQQQLDMMKSIAPKEYHHLLTPHYPYGCKRRVFDAEWLPSMHKPNYTLTNRKVVAIDGNQLVLGPEEIAAADKMGEERINADVVHPREPIRSATMAAPAQSTDEMASLCTTCGSSAGVRRHTWVWLSMDSRTSSLPSSPKPQTATTLSS